MITLCSATTYDYFYNLELLIKSIEILNINYKLIVECINFSNKQRAASDKLYSEELKTGRLELIYTYPKLNNKNELKGYATNRRAYLLKRLSLNKEGLIGYIDINTIILKGFIHNILKRKDIDAHIVLDQNHICLQASSWNYQKAFELAKNKKYQKYIGPLGSIMKGVCLAGIQIYKINKLTRELIYNYVKLVDKSPNSWWTDQEALALLILKYKSKLSLNLFSDENIGLSTITPKELICISSKTGRENLYKDYSFFMINYSQERNKLMSSNPYFTEKKLLRIKRKMLHKIKIYILLILKKISFINLDLIMEKLKFHLKKIIFRYINKKVKRTLECNTNLFYSFRYPTTYGIFKGIRLIKSYEFFFFAINVLLIPDKELISYKDEMQKDIDYSNKYPL
tara:strand:- start:20 stop:1213 length:1194 start_codon:yes stop_codon:yes gene_type:complete